MHNSLHGKYENISLAQTKHSPLKLWDGRPARPVFAESGTPHKPHPQIVPRRSHSPAFGQSHAAGRPDRP
ncbi:hypothetical protein [Oscillatoria nigro-viridis]|uniref:hypothetical protein n=1 Tax=Phormidium nigroviride TaxID=482564 RepID=UPI0012372059|nr:hypothetical protein [Oscillatoria nigro-viridis]